MSDGMSERQRQYSNPEPRGDGVASFDGLRMRTIVSAIDGRGHQEKSFILSPSKDAGCFCSVPAEAS